MNIFNITYLMLANNCGARTKHSGKTLLYDMGCSVWADGAGQAAGMGQATDKKVNAALGSSSAASATASTDERGSGFGPSLPLFDELYATQCLPLDHMFGWESREMSASEWWAPVPASVRPRLTFYNIPVEEANSSAASFSSHLLAASSPEDFVAVKLDIDYVPVELPIAKAILSRPELSSRVDELFFEYHFNLDGITSFPWRSAPGQKHAVTDNVDDALRLFTALRHKGVRAHFWICLLYTSPSPRDS